MDADLGLLMSVLDALRPKAEAKCSEFEVSEVFCPSFCTASRRRPQLLHGRSEALDPSDECKQLNGKSIVQQVRLLSTPTRIQLIESSRKVLEYGVRLGRFGPSCSARRPQRLSLPSGAFYTRHSSRSVCVPAAQAHAAIAGAVLRDSALPGAWVRIQGLPMTQTLHSKYGTLICGSNRMSDV